LLAEIDRLNGVIDMLNDPKLVGLALEPGGSIRMDLAPCLGAKVLAASFADMILDAPNWKSVEISPIDSDQGTLIVTVQRKCGRSPAEMVFEAKDIIRDLMRTFAINLPSWNHPDTRNLVDRARAFIAPVESNPEPHN
jgi:hypothetical protein